MDTSPSFLLLVLFAAAAAVLPAAMSATFPGDTEALAAVKQAIDPASIPPGSCLGSWDFSRDPCDSSFGDRFTCGLRCDATDSAGLRRVTDLTLDPAGYSGALSPAVWSLPYLQSLDAADSRLSGPIPPPPSSGLPPSLRRISLSRNSFSGPIPTLPPAPALEELALDGNLLSGQIPAGLSALGRLRRLELQGNNLTGEIPDLRGLSQLYSIDASGNGISGGFAGAASLPPSLVEVLLRQNRLDGGISGAGLTGMPLLQVLDLSKNVLSGGVPAAALQHPSLEQLSLAGNRLEWVESPAPGAGSSNRLVALDLGHNRLEGMLPGIIGDMPRLTAVDLQDNRFTGMIPAEYGLRAAGAAPEEGVAFGRLLLSGNYLVGPIPGPMGGMKKGAAVVSLADNCLWRCPPAFFFCEDGRQKPPAACREFNPVIP